MIISRTILLLTLLLLLIQPIFSSADQSINLFQQENEHLIFSPRSVQDSTKQIRKKVHVKPKNHTELWFIGIGSPTALLGILGAVWPAIVFFVIAFALILLAIALEIFEPDDYILWNLNEIDHIIFWIALVLAAIAITAGIIILIGHPFPWIGLGIAAIGILWWIGKTIRLLIRRRQKA